LVWRAFDAVAGRDFRRLALVFHIWELRVSDPIVNLRILKNHNFAVACSLFFLFGAAIYGLVALQPLFLQTLLATPRWRPD